MTKINNNFWPQTMDYTISNGWTPRFPSPSLAPLDKTVHIIVFSNKEARDEIFKQLEGRNYESKPL